MATTDPPERDTLVLLRESVERGFDDVRDRFDGVDRDIAALAANQEVLAGNQEVFAANQEVLAGNQEVFAANLERFAATTAEYLQDLLARVDTLFGGLADLRRHYNVHTEHPPEHG